MKNLKSASIILLVILSSCYTERRGLRQFNRFHNLYPYKAAEFCNLWYPIKEKDSLSIRYIKGDTIWKKTEPIPYDCDKFIKERDSLSKLGYKTQKNANVKCPDCPYTLDTLKEYQFKILEKTSALKEKDGIIIKKDELILDLESDKASIKKALSISLWLNITLGCSWILFFLIKYFKR